MSPTNTEQLKDNLSEAGTHLKSAASAAGEAVKGATSAAGDELKLGRANVKAELSDTALAGMAAAEFGGAATDLIRERPLAAFGVAFAAGWIIAKLARSNDN